MYLTRNRNARDVKRKKERKKKMKNISHLFSLRSCKQFSISTDEIERLSISLKNNLCLASRFLKLIVHDTAYIHLYTEIPVWLDTRLANPFAFETNIRTHVSKVRRQHKTNIDAAWLSTYCRYSDIL